MDCLAGHVLASGIVRRHFWGSWNIVYNQNPTCAIENKCVTLVYIVPGTAGIVPSHTPHATSYLENVHSYRKVEIEGQ